MERKAYPVDEKLFDLLLEEDFDKLNAGELQKLFDNSSYEISDRWVFISNKTCTAYGFLDHSLKEDCDIITISLKGVSNGETKKIHP